MSSFSWVGVFRLKSEDIEIRGPLDAIPVMFQDLDKAKRFKKYKAQEVRLNFRNEEGMSLPGIAMQW